MIYFITTGTVLGLSAGFAPGPLLTLVIMETLQHDIKSGIKIAMAPLITDLPIIILSLFVMSKLSDFHLILGIISLAGGCFILNMSCKSLPTRSMTAVDWEPSEPKSLAKGVLANALSPHPYLFWMSVGAPIMTKAMLMNIGALLSFVVSFYAFLVGSKMLLAICIGKSKSLLSSKGYVFTMRLLALALGVLACALFYDGFRLIGNLKV
jgi:threonine/homoserine/homoserine lactone efflux protein